jgi:hypothetical protein
MVRPHMSTSSGRARLAWLWHPGVMVAMLGLAILHTWPMARFLDGYIAGGPREDPYMNAWHLWWMKRAFTEGLNPFLTPYLHHPLGAELYWHTLAPAKTTLGILLLPMLSPELAYNLLILSTFVTTGWAMWLLLRELLLRAAFEPDFAACAAFAGACVFNFSRYHLAHSFAHLNLSSLEGIPLYIFFLLRFLDGGRRKDLVGLALAGAYTLLCDYYYLVYEALFSVVYVLALRWRRGPVLSWQTPKDPAVQRAVWAGGATLLACLPLLMPLILHAFPQPISIWHGDSDYHSDLVGFFLPDRASGWLRSMSPALKATVRALDGNMEEDGYFLGWGTLAIGLYAFWRGVPSGRFWLWMGVGFSVLSLGTRLAVGGSTNVHPTLILAFIAALLLASRRVREKSWGLDVGLFVLFCAVVTWFSPLTAYERPLTVELPMPYVLFKTVVPFFSRGGMPVRLQLLMTVTLAVLFAFGVAYLARRFAKGENRLGQALCLGLALIPNLEYRNLPMEMEPVPERSPIFEQIRAEPKEVAVFADEHAYTQFEQIYHEHPITYARLSRLPVREAAMVGSRLYQSLMFKRRLQEPVSEEEATRMRAYLKEHRIKYYVNHTPHPVVDQFVTEALQGQIVSQEFGRVVYRFKDVE